VVVVVMVEEEEEEEEGKRLSECLTIGNRNVVTLLSRE
jgi:hypothetical protein